MLLAAAPGVLLAVLSLRKQMAHPLHVLIAWFLGAYLGGKAQVLMGEHGARQVLQAWRQAPVAPLGLWGVAIGSSLLTALYFAVSRPPKTS